MDLCQLQATNWSVPAPYRPNFGIHLGKLAKIGEAAVIQGPDPGHQLLVDVPAPVLQNLTNLEVRVFQISQGNPDHEV